MEEIIEGGSWTNKQRDEVGKGKLRQLDVQMFSECSDFFSPEKTPKGSGESTGAADQIPRDVLERTRLCCPEDTGI